MKDDLKHPLEGFRVDENEILEIPSKRFKRKKEIHHKRLSNHAVLSLCLVTGMATGIGTAHADEMAQKPINEEALIQKENILQQHKLDQPISSSSRVSKAEESVESAKEQNRDQNANEQIDKGKNDPQAPDEPLSNIPQEKTRKSEKNKEHKHVDMQEEEQRNMLSQEKLPDQPLSESNKESKRVTKETSPQEGRGTDSEVRLNEKQVDEPIANAPKPRVEEKEIEEKRQAEQRSEAEEREATPSTKGNQASHHLAKQEENKQKNSVKPETNREDKTVSEANEKINTKESQSTSSSSSPKSHPKTVQGGRLPDTAGSELSHALTGALTALGAGIYLARKRKENNEVE